MVLQLKLLDGRLVGSLVELSCTAHTRKISISKKLAAKNKQNANIRYKQQQQRLQQKQANIFILEKKVQLKTTIY